MKQSLHLVFLTSILLFLLLPFTSYSQSTSSPCDDGDPNTIDIVDGEGNCIHITKVCNDGKGTTITLTIPATTECTDIPCDDGNPKTVDIVDINGECHHIQLGCDDGDPTTRDYVDDNGNCVNEPIVCDDGDPETEDYIDENGVCHHVKTVYVCDECPDDPNKTEPGECGCGVPDIDSDGDGTPDCNDLCPDGPEPGQPCDDGNPNTLNDRVDANCGCVGELPDPCEDDKDDPFAYCQRDLTVILGEGGMASITPEDIDRGSYDECGKVKLSIDKNKFNCDDLGYVMVTLTVTDESGNTDLCSTKVRVTDPNHECDPCIPDNEKPVAKCKEELTVILGSGAMASITPEDIDDGSYDECGEVKLAIDKDKFDCDDLGYVTVTLTVTDESGHSDQCTTKVKVTDPNYECDPCIPDNEKPVAKCKEELTVILGEGAMASITPKDIDDGSYDECGEVKLAIDKDKFDCDDLGYVTVTLTVTDESGHSDQCTTKVKVTDPNYECDPCIPDNEKPVARCKEEITVILGEGAMASITPEDIDDGSYDECGEVKLAIDKDKFDCDDLGYVTVTLTVTDESGHSDQCTTKVKVTDPNYECDPCIPDNEKPVARCKDVTVEIGSDGKVTITPEMVDNGSYDECGEVKLSVDPKHFDCDDLGKNRVTLTVRDESGNEDNCKAEVTVTDPEGYCDEPLNDCDPNTLDPCEVQIIWYDCNTLKICIGKYDFSNIRADLGEKGYQDNNTDPKDDDLKGQTYYYDVSQNGIPNGFWIKSSNNCGTCNEDPDNNGAQGGPGEACPKENGAGVYYEVPARPLECNEKIRKNSIQDFEEYHNKAFKLESINIFPNPGSNDIFLSMKGFEDVNHQFSVHNTMGEMIKSFERIPDNEPINLEVKNLPSGVYYLRIIKPDGNFVTKEFVIKR